MLSPVEEIKSRIDIVDLIQSYVRLHKSGINYKANCPFHSEKTPSFFVSPTRQIWHCFGGCGKGGDIFKFVMEIEGCEFPEALRTLAQRAGVVLRREDPRIHSEKNRLYDVCEEAAKIFEKSFSLTPAVRTYMKGRGVSDEMLKEFRVGFAPQSWDFLIKKLGEKGFKKEDIVGAGLAIQSEDRNSWYDRFRSRIMFPIMDANDRVIGFSGRVFDTADSRGQVQTRTGADKVEAKYVNTPNTLIYDKSRALYGFDKAKQEIRAKNQVVVVEGQMDCLMSYQAGVKNVIAVSGTALTPQQLKTIKRLCDTMVSSFDADSAGQSATRRSLALASQFEFDRKVAVIPSGKDPADTVRENPQSWLDAVQGAKPVVEFYFEKATKENDPATPQGKKAISAMLMPWIAELANEIEKSHWVGKLAEKLGVTEEAVSKELKKSSYAWADEHTRAAPAEPAKIPTRRELLEERMLSLMPVVARDVRTRELEGKNFIFTTALRGKIFSHLQGMLTETDEELLRQVEMFRFKGEVLAQVIQDPAADFATCRKELEKECIKDELQGIGGEITRAEAKGGAGDVGALLQKFSELSQKLKEF